MIRALPFALLLAACGSAAVGLDCIEGRVVCDGDCVDLASDADHCGACGNTCGQGEACVLGVCGGTTDRDGGVDDRDGAVDAGAERTCRVNETLCDGVCRRLDVNPEHCGACDVACEGAELCVAGICEESCDEPYLMCGADCVLLRSDPNHCGECDVVCQDGPCIRGVCEVAPAGHVVAIGHDYLQSTEAMARLAANALYLAPVFEPTVVVFDDDTAPAVTAGLDAAFNRGAELGGQRFERRGARADNLAGRLPGAHVLLIYPETRSDDSTLQELGSTLRSSFDGFLAGGGVIVVFDGPSDRNSGTSQILAGAGLWPATVTAVPSEAEAFDVVDPGDALVVGVPLRYRALGGTVAFQGVDEAMRVVIGPEGTIAWHRAFVP